MRSTHVACWLVCIVLMTACAGGGGGPQPLEWVFLAFLDGDGDREWQACTNLAQLELVNANGSQVGIVAFLDRHPKPTGVGYLTAAIPTVGGTDWSDTRWGRVTYDGTASTYATTMQHYSTTKPEVSVGHPSVLNGFVTKAMALLPAKHYALIIYDHGAPDGIAVDESQNDFLSTGELSAVLDALPYIDILILDACNMQCVEVATELIGEVGFVLASQQIRWGKSLGSNIYYNWSLDWLVANPTATPKAFARRLLQDDQHGNTPGANASIIDVAGMPALNTALDAFADAALTHAGGLDWPVLASLQATPRYFHSKSYRDLREYMQAVDNAVGLPAPIRSAAQTVYNLLDTATATVVVEKEGDGEGLSIVLPANANGIPHWYTKHGFDFLDETATNGTSWLDFLRKLPTPAGPWIEAYLDGLNDVLPDTPGPAPEIGPQGVVSWIDSLLEDPLDLDYLKIVVPPGGDVTPVLYAEVVGEQAGALPALRVFGSDGATELGEGLPDAGAVARIEGLALSEGTHYLAIGSTGPAPPPLHALSSESGTGRYTVRVLFGDPSEVAPRVEVSESALDFGMVAAGTWATLPLRITNQGCSTLRITALDLTGDAGFLAPYEQLALPFEIPAGDSVEFRVGVRPDGPGELDAALTITSNDPQAPTTVVSLHTDGL